MKPLNLTEGGRREWESTAGYAESVRKIVTEVKEKYSPTLMNEKNWRKRILISFRRWTEIKKRINELSSQRNLHATSPRIKVSVNVV